MLKNGLGICCGGIIGLGESLDDRLELIRSLADRHLSPIQFSQSTAGDTGSPLEKNKPVIFWEFLPLVAIARMALPDAMIRLSAGRVELSVEQQALSFLWQGQIRSIQAKNYWSPHLPILLRIRQCLIYWA